MSSPPVADEPFDRGHVLWHEGLFRDSGRPWFVVSDDRHPFHGEEYVVAGITTTERDGTVELDDASWVMGGLPRTSYVLPWFLTTLKHTRIDRGVGAVTDKRCATVIDRVTSYLD